jgi:hypothetical protein
MPRIFINYRRGEKSGLAGRIYDRCVAFVGKDQVFRDVDTIPAGAIFPEFILAELRSCDVLLVLIDSEWAAAKDAQGRGLDSAENHVRLELAEALELKKRILPVLLGGAKTPDRLVLPTEIADLADIHGLELSESRFDFDVGRLLDRADPRRVPRRKLLQRGAAVSTR